jgi:hypothetical protein
VRRRVDGTTTVWTVTWKPLILVAVLLVMTACGNPGLSPAEKTACQSVLRDASDGLTAAESQLSSHNNAAIAGAFSATADAMRSDIGNLPSGKVRAALLGWANDLTMAATVGPTSPKGIQLVKAGAIAAGSLCGK